MSLCSLSKFKYLAQKHHNVLNYFQVFPTIPYWKADPRRWQMTSAQKWNMSAWKLAARGQLAKKLQLKSAKMKQIWRRGRMGSGIKHFRARTCHWWLIMWGFFEVVWFILKKCLVWNMGFGMGRVVLWIFIRRLSEMGCCCNCFD